MAYKNSAGLVGNVSERTLETVALDVSIHTASDKPNAEYVVFLNGRVLRRMTYYQAKRFGIVSEMPLAEWERN